MHHGRFLIISFYAEFGSEEINIKFKIEQRKVSKLFRNKNRHYQMLTRMEPFVQVLTEKLKSLTTMMEERYRKS
jgi:hypothetical protein